jgi:hypothetical protein
LVKTHDGRNKGEAGWSIAIDEDADDQVLMRR